MPTKIAQTISAADLRKTNGVHYTPRSLANFVAKQMIIAGVVQKPDPLQILDPAAGDGELLSSLLECLEEKSRQRMKVTGFDIDEYAVRMARTRLEKEFPEVDFELTKTDFVDYALRYANDADSFYSSELEKFDVVISNPPYVRTQAMGAEQSQSLSGKFELSGRVDLYHVFIRGIASVLKIGGIAGLIVSNRFMTTKSGAEIRRIIEREFEIVHVWDLGDTKLFEAAVLPAVLILKKKSIAEKQFATAFFTSIYSLNKNVSQPICKDVFSALEKDGEVEIKNDRSYLVQHGTLNSDENSSQVWRIATDTSDVWLETVKRNTFCTFKEIGKIRVGVKTTADNVFIRSDWDELPVSEQPELLKPLITHHIARRFKAHATNKSILYTHYSNGEKRTVVQLSDFPRAMKYLDKYRKALESREYLKKNGRNWFEIWVPQDPAAWAKPKIVFRDIASSPTFWMDLSGAVVNGDCYWLTNDYKKNDGLLWLCLAVGNSTFIEVFYDHSFNNKLYAGRRRFMTQYVEKFPVPNPQSEIAKSIVKKTKSLYKSLSESSTVCAKLESEIDTLVWQSFGFSFEEIPR